MLARTNKVIHPSGIEIETPLLIPSFSSKGFSFKKKKKKRDPDVSETLDALEYSKEFLTESLLISAYDIFYKHLPFTETSICTDVTIIDSGGYECGGTYDLSTTTKYNYDLKDWNIENYKKVLLEWPEHKAAIAVSFDHGNHKVPLTEQIESAKKLFSEFPLMTSNFLIKPETKDKPFIQVKNVIAQIDEMKSFNIIGVTERELGGSILQRMLNIAKIREALDAKGNSSPIHVFGSLDPITSILYFLVGAEIFDGLTWLKYSYFNSSAVYRSNFGVLNNELGISFKDSEVKSMTITKNAYYLQKMKYIMKDFIVHKDFKMFNEIGGDGFGEILERSFKTFQSSK